ncbi:MAG TPA: aminotransferase class I/II-fold pyridoxal phosphate-dependent enzyme, partial [Thermoanaerobaculia bacterium]|nr:aminotransferase class I/II-fold pyridoxal phosphate-dependent enzyme [Thermoanaerobaculia bacterium]
VLRVRSNSDSGMFLPIQRAAAAALEGSRDELSALRKTYGERRALGNELLRALGCSASGEQAGVFVWAKAPDSVSDVDAWLDEVLLETRVFLAPGSIFGAAGRRFVRLSLCNPASSLAEARSRIDAFVSRRDARRLAS